MERPHQDKHPLTGEIHRLARERDHRTMNATPAEQMRAVLLNCASTLRSTATDYDQNGQPRMAAYLRERADEADAALRGPESLDAWYRQREENDRLAAEAWADHQDKAA